MMMVMILATASFIMVMMVITTAATARFLMMVMVVATTTTAGTFIVVMVATTTTAGTFIVVMVAATAATTTPATASMSFNANRLERFFNFRHFKTDQTEHLGDIGKREHGKAFGGFSHFYAAIDERTDGFLHRAQIPRHMEHLFYGRTNHPELAGIVDEHVVDHKRALIFHRHRNGAFGRFKGIAPGHALFGRYHELLGTSKDRLSRSRFWRQELGKSRHFEILLRTAAGVMYTGVCTSEFFFHFTQMRTTLRNNLCPMAPPQPKHRQVCRRR